MRLLFCFGSFRVDTCSLCLPSILPAPPLGSSPSFLWRPLTSHSQRVRAPLWSVPTPRPLGWASGTTLENLYIPSPNPVISSRMGMESKRIIWDSGIWVELLGKRSWAGRLYQSSVGSGRQRGKNSGEKNLPEDETSEVLQSRQSQVNRSRENERQNPEDDVSAPLSSQTWRQINWSLVLLTLLWIGFLSLASKEGLTSIPLCILPNLV